MAHEKIINISDSNFEEEVIKSNIPVLVDFWAEWCAPCKMVEPTLESIADEYNGRKKVGRLNVDENPESASKYRITSIPSLLFFKDNKVVDMLVGAVPKEYIKDVIDRIL
ncbi:MAG: thioredoxin [Candidatus Coatesbacteria bacterium]|nr:MAG: thioredoxin [Candidatus Coatesbacteria bacterium]